MRNRCSRTSKTNYQCSLPDDFLAQLQTQTLAAFQTELQSIPGVAEALQCLPGLRCVASSSTLERVRLSLDLTGLLALLEPHLYSATMVANGKPAPDLFLHAAQQMGVETGDCVVIEDSVPGVLAAKAAGMIAYGFTGGSHVEASEHTATLLAAGADRVIAHMDELNALLG